jgi:circadian clock protein KaiC
VSALEGRLPTGIPGLDAIIGGGLLRGALAFVVGAPGAGKTVLVEQAAFHAAHTGPVLYFTTLSEPHTKLIGNVRQFAFFDESLVGERLQFLNLEQTLRQGPEETADAIVEMARSQRALLVVLDGFRSVADFVEQPVRVREFLYQLAARLAVVGTVCLVTFEGDPFDRALYPELATADVILGVWQDSQQTVQHRTLVVFKARGSVSLPGSHSFYISSQGITCYPQAESLPVKAAGTPLTARAPFGIAGLDALLGGGPTAGSSTILAGGLGAGKTVLSLAWLLEGARQGKPGLYVGFHESEQQLVERASVFGYDLADAIAAGRIAVWTQLPIGLDGNRLAADLRERVEAGQVRRLVIDTEYDVERSLPPERAATYLTALIAYLRGEGVTTLVTQDIPASAPADLDFAGTPGAALAENVVLLRALDRRGPVRHTVSVLKMRFSGFDPTPHAYRLDPAGITIGGPVADGETSASATDSGGAV